MNPNALDASLSLSLPLFRLHYAAMKFRHSRTVLVSQVSESVVTLSFSSF